MSFPDEAPAAEGWGQGEGGTGQGGRSDSHLTSLEGGWREDVGKTFSPQFDLLDLTQESGILHGSL